MTSEAYIAGAILIDGQQVIKLVQGIITWSDFQSTTCGAIFSAALELAADNEAIDPVSVRERAKRDGVELSNEYLTELMDAVPTAANCVQYAHRVAEDARTRRIKDLATQIQLDDVSSPDELLATLQRETDAIRGSSFQNGLLSPEESVKLFYSHIVDAGKGKHSFVSSGFGKLDAILGGGFIRGGLYILGARPAVGKTTFAINLADTIEGNCLFVSLEMTPEQIVSKRISRLINIPSSRLLSGQIAESEWEQITRACSFLSNQGVRINRRYDMTVQQIHLQAQAVPELQAVIIDYLGLIQPACRGASTYENVSQISRDLKKMALSLNVPVICLSQLSRDVEKRENKKPRLSDLRDSGSVEQDADAVAFLFRPDYYADGGNATGYPSLVQLEVAKNRHGQTGYTDFAFSMDRSRFSEVVSQ